MIQIIDRTGERRQMKNPVNFSVNGDGRTHIMLNKLEGGIGGEMLYVLVVTSDEVVKTDNLVSLTDEPVAKM